MRSIRKRNGFTLEELSARCIQMDAKGAPSESYLSMIEGGKRNPSAALLALLARVFQREAAWFLNDRAALDDPAEHARGRANQRTPSCAGQTPTRRPAIADIRHDIIGRNGTL